MQAFQKLEQQPSFIYSCVAYTLAYSLHKHHKIHFTIPSTTPTTPTGGGDGVMMMLFLCWSQNANASVGHRRRRRRCAQI